MDVLLEHAATPRQGCNEPAAVLLLPATQQGAGLPVQGGGGQVLPAPQAEGVHHTSCPGGKIGWQGCFLCWLSGLSVAIPFVGGGCGFKVRRAASEENIAMCFINSLSTSKYVL